DANRDSVVAYIRGFSAGVDWLYDPANKAEALAILRKNLPTLDEKAAEASYRILLSPTDGFQKKAKIDLAGVRTVLQLRSKYAEPRKNLSDPARYYDESFYREALR
ncbi:MAG: ABC transporter substrate-binding protein, partial [Betaproteobacteria bacterium]|nr:ABC transporter substrate-binding protein [Betaproteobacteria bacterium]